MIIFARCPRRAVSDLDEIVAAVRDAHAGTVLFDVEPLVADWGSDAASLDRGLATTRTRLADVAGLHRLIFLTNARRAPASMPAAAGPLAVSYVARARKPWRARRLGPLPPPIAVVGDQLLTDGLLAWRLRAQPATFLHAVTHPGPLWPRLQRAAGRLIAPLLFRTA